MSFFGNKENIEKLKNKGNNLTSKVKDMIKLSKQAKLGDFVYFDKVLKNFVIYKENSILPEPDSNEFISIGIVLSQTTNFKTTVLIKSFLLEEPLRIPITYYANENYIPVYIKQMYERYVRGFIKKCPNYKKLKRMKLRILTLDNLLSFLSYGPMYNNLTQLIGKEKTDDFYKKIDKYKIYVNDRGKLRTWQKPINEKDDSNVEDPTPRGGNFLIVFDIQL